MMKKGLCILLICLLCLGAAACRRETELPVIDTAPQPGETPPADGSRPDNAQGAQQPDETPRIEISEHELAAVVRFVSVFNTYPQPFTSPDALDDYALFFAAAGRMNADFTPESDGVTYSLPILELEAAVRAIFGPQAALSDGWAQKDYAPYTVDTAAGVVRRTSMGTFSVPLYPYRCTRTETGLELTMLCLSDPLFAGRYPDAADSPDAVTPEMLDGIAGEMMAYVYTLAETDGGGYLLTGFRFANEKPLDAV